MMRTSSARAVVAVLIAGLSVTACLLITLDAPTARTTDQRTDLQRLVGGLGLGPAVDLSRCGHSFDPRLCPDCPLNHAPVPGGVWFCPQHACAIRCYSRLAFRGGEGGRDGRLP